MTALVAWGRDIEREQPIGESWKQLDFVLGARELIPFYRDSCARTLRWYLPFGFVLGFLMAAPDIPRADHRP